MNARELLATALIDQPERLQLTEEFERQTPPAPQFSPTQNTAEGVVGTTSNGGTLTVANGAQGFTPLLNQSYQLNLSQGQASLVANSKPQQTTQDASIVNAIVATRAPTTNDPGQRDQLWFNVNQPLEGSIRIVETWAFISQLGQWHRISGGGGGPTILYNPRPPDYDTVDPINNPPPHAPADGDIWVDTSLESISGVSPRWWRYQASANLYRNTSGNIVFDGINPIGAGLDTDSLVQGDLLISTNQGTNENWMYRWDVGVGDWVKASCCPDQPDDPPDDGDGYCSDPGDQWYDNGSPWGGCTSEPPP